MAVANEKAVSYAELTDEHITDIKKALELFVPSEEYWDKFAHHCTVKRGHKTFSCRRLVKPKVKAEDVVARAEFTAPRPTKIVVETFEKTVANYGDKAIYSKEDMQFHFDDTVKNITDTLKEIAVQKLNFIKAKPFLQSACILTYDTSCLKTLDKGSVVLRKNGAKRWDGKHWLVHCTPELKTKIIGEIRALGQSLSEPVKVQLAGREYDFDCYGDFIFSDTIDASMYKSDTVQYLVIMGKRGIDGNSPVDVSKLEGESNIELINNGLGSGVLVDVDGNYTADDNKQQGSVAINMDGLGACVSDDLCILDCEVTVDEIKGSALFEQSKTGFVSISGNEIEITASAGTKTHFAYVGARYDSTASKYYANGSVLLSAQVLADEGEAFSGGTAPAANNWTVQYKLTSGGSNIDAEIIGVVKTAVDYDTVIVRVPEKAYSFTITSAATAD